MKIDTQISHVTKPGTNLFLELGFSAEEAKQLHGQSRRQIEQAKATDASVKAAYNQFRTK